MGKECGKCLHSSTEIHERFVDHNDLFTIAFFGENYRPALAYCGKISGRDEDKVKNAGLTPYFTDGTVAF